MQAYTLHIYMYRFLGSCFAYTGIGTFFDDIKHAKSRVFDAFLPYLCQDCNNKMSTVVLFTLKMLLSMCLVCVCNKRILILCPGKVRIALDINLML